jgi:hypothetical protein
MSSVDGVAALPSRWMSLSSGVGEASVGLLCVTERKTRTLYDDSMDCNTFWGEIWCCKRQR